jgi:hypothetical protein
MLPSQVFKRIIPPRAGLLRPCTFTFSFPILDGIFKEGISMGRFFYPGYYLGQIRVPFFHEPDTQFELDQYAYK